MRKIFLLILLFVGVKASCQIPFEMGAIKIDSVYLNESSRWLKEYSNDTTLASEDSTAAISEYAAKTYIDNEIAEKQDSIDNLRDTVQSHNTRLIAVESSTSGALQDSINAHTDSLQSHNTRVNTNLTSITSQADSINYLGDTTRSHNTRLIVLEDSVHQHANKTTLDAVTAAYLDADSTRLAGVNDTVIVMIRVTDDTLTTSEVYAGYILPFSTAFNGWQLVEVLAYSPGEGTGGTAAVNVYRLRGGSRETVTDSGADIGGSASIDDNYDDIETGDYYDFGYVETGASPNTIAVDVYLKLIRP